MIKTRRLQYIGKQFSLNVPRTFIKDSQWEKGDHIAIARTDKDTLEICKIASKDMSRDEVTTSLLREEIRRTYGALLHRPEYMDPTEFSWNLSQLSHLFGKLRRCESRMIGKAFQEPMHKT